MRAVVDWLDERAGVRALWRWLADEEIPGGARLRYVFGSVLAYLFAQQVLIGILLASYYSPSATDAWASTAYLNDRVAGGWFLRGLHHHASSAMVVVTVLHLCQVAWAGAYRRPRELNWWAGLMMGGLVLAFSLTGYLLPWDQKGYWATQVATGIMGSVPGGEPLKLLLQGGTEYGNLTLTRFYALHVFVLPILLGSLLVVHVGLFRRHGVTPPAALEDRPPAKVTRFYPDQAFLDVTAMAVTGIVLVLLTYETHGAELFAPAQPASNFVARPEWYFLFLFQLLKYFDGPLQIVATVLIPGAVATFLLALPLLDRGPTRRAGARWRQLSGIGVIMAGVVVLTTLAMAEDRDNQHFQDGLAEARAEAERARTLAEKGVLPTGGDAVYLNDPEVHVRNLFAEHCKQCHTVDGVGGNEAPDLSDYSSRTWLFGMIRGPNDVRYFGGTKHSAMDPYPADALPDADLKAVVEHLVSLMDEPHDAALATRGKALFEDTLDCTTCHETKPGASGDGPNLRGHGTRAWVERMLRDSSQPDLFGKEAQMPKFGRKLSDEDIAALSDFVVRRREPTG